MRFFCLHQGYYEGVSERLELLKNSCIERLIEFISINSLTYDYSNLPIIRKGDLIYNCARGSEILETIMLKNDATSFYIQKPFFVVNNPDTTKYIPAQENIGIAAPKTIFHITNNRDLLKKYVDYLQGFPIIIKATGGTRGVGTLKLDNWHTLLSVVDYLITTGDKFVMRQFILNSGTARLVVLGDEVIASEFRENLENDFRVSSISGDVNYYKKGFSKSVNDLAVKASQVSNFQTTGVDIIFDKFDQPYVLEVNFPHNFIPPQQITGVNISSLMVDFLINKATKNGA